MKVEVEDIKIELDDDAPIIVIKKASIKEIAENMVNEDINQNKMKVPFHEKANSNVWIPKYDSTKSFEEVTALILDYRK